MKIDDEARRELEAMAERWKGFSLIHAKLSVSGGECDDAHEGIADAYTIAQAELRRWLASLPTESEKVEREEQEPSCGVKSFFSDDSFCFSQTPRRGSSGKRQFTRRYHD